MGSKMLSFLKTKIWPYIIALAGVVISVIVVIVRSTMKENSRLKARVENAEARVNRARVVAQEDIRLTQDEQIREAKIADELKNGHTDFDPNDLFRVRNDKDNN